MNDIGAEDIVAFEMSTPGIGTYQVGETVYQGFTYSNAVATGKVVLWSNNILHLTNINGNFISSQPIYSINNNASYTFVGYNLDGVTSQKMADIVIEPNPTTANANSLYTYTTTITEY